MKFDVIWRNPLCKSDDLMNAMMERYGPLLGGEQLWRALGYQTWAAFARAARNGSLGVKVFSVPGRKGRFALTADVATWISGLKE